MRLGPICFLASASVLWLTVAEGQNVVQNHADPRSVAPTKVTAEAAEMLIQARPKTGRAPETPKAVRVRTKLNAHVEQMIAGWPWMPLHQTLGISGSEIYFDHPDGLFYASALALPFLEEQTVVRAKAFLSKELTAHPPFGAEGYDRHVGQARESYDVPTPLRRSGKGEAASAFGVYAFWLWCRVADDPEAAREHWGAIRERMKFLLDNAYVFDPSKRDSSRGESEKLNGDIAGLLGFARLAEENEDADARRLAASRLRELLELRANLERTNPSFVEKTNAATKGLHNFRLSRFGSLSEELGSFIERESEGLASSRLRAFREARNGWFLTLGDRLIGGENYTSPLHLTQAMFAGAAFIEHLSGEELFRWIDVPASRADFFFIEKSALALQRAAD